MTSLYSRIQHHAYIAITIIALGAFFGVLLLRSRSSVEPRIVAGDVVIPVSIADTDSERAQGLSGTASLAPGTGKLFIFPQVGNYGFWMKDMRYPIDIVWIDSSWQVVSVDEQVSPESYPSVYYPPSAVQYVLEVNAGEATGDNLLTGAKLQFHQ